MLETSARLGALLGMVEAGICGAEPRLLIIASGNCQDAELVSSATSLGEVLKEKVGDDLMDRQELLKKLGSAASHSIEEVQAQLDSAKVQYFSSEYFKAKAKVEDALQEINRLPVGPNRWGLAVSAHLLQALILKQSNQLEDANQSFQRVLRLVPNFQLDPDYYSPSTVADFESVRKTVNAARLARLMVRSTPSGADVYLDGLKVGVSPFNGDYLPGRYEVAVAKDGTVSRTHVVELADTKLIHIDLDFEGMLSTRGVTCIADVGDDRAWVGAAVKIGSLMGTDEVVVARLEKPQMRAHWLTASLVSATTGGKTREAGLKIDGVPAMDDYAKLADFVVTGKAEGIVVVDDAKATPAPWAPQPVAVRESPLAPSASDRPWRVASYVTWGAAGVALATGGVLILVNKSDVDELKQYQGPDGSIVDSSRSRELLATTAARRHVATGLLVGGGIGVVCGAVIHWIAKGKEKPPVEVTARLQPSEASVVVAASF